MRQKKSFRYKIISLLVMFFLISSSSTYGKVVGILGGLGPHTTSIFYLDVVNNYIEATNDKHRPSILVWSVSLDIKKESNFIHNGANQEYLLRKLTQGAISLSNANVDFIVIPCNTVHKFLPELKKTTPRIKYLSILEETAKYAKKKNIKKVLLLATSQTIRDKLYTKPLTKRDISVITPNADEQEKIDYIILNILHNRETNKDKKLLDNIIKKYHVKRVDNVILGCTDLQKIVNNKDYKNIVILDSMSILAQATAAEALKD